MGERRSPVVIGALLAALVLVVAAAALAWRMRALGDASHLREPGRVVVVFALPDDEGAQVAAAVAVWDAASGTWQVVDADATGTVSSETSYDRIRDAYPFGGAPAVAAALGLTGRDVGWADVPQPALSMLIGQEGIAVGIPETMDVWDGHRLTTFGEGTDTVAGDRVAALVNGARHLSARDSLAVRDAVTRGALARLGTWNGPPPPGVRTNLAPSALDALRSAARTPAP